jgi:hypothetical protein
MPRSPGATRTSTPWWSSPAAVAFIIGSVFFFYNDLAVAADWILLAGSILFAVRPTVAVAQQLHLARVPLNPVGRPAAEIWARS